MGEAAESGGEFRDQLRGKLGRLLEAITGGAVRALDDLGIVPKMERGRQPFEQEAPGRARLSQWPFYA